MAWKDIQLSDGRVTCSEVNSVVQLGAKGEKSTPFTMLAYTGQAIRVDGWPHPVVMDINAMKISKHPRPVLRDHRVDRPVGHASFSRNGKQIVADGMLSFDGADAAEITASGKKGFPWQASVGVRPDQVTFIDEDQTMNVNGRTVKGPAFHVVGTLKESSFVVLGADDDTVSRVAAARESFGEFQMFEQWLQSHGLKASELAPDVLARYQGIFSQMNLADGTATGTPAEAVVSKASEPVPVVAPAPIAAVAAVAAVASPAPATDVIAQAIEQAQYVAAVQAAAAGDAAILAEALSARWTPEVTRLTRENRTLTAARPSGGGALPAIHSIERQQGNDVIEAALSLSMGVSPEELVNPYAGMNAATRRGAGNVVAAVPQVTVDAALRQFPYLGLKDCLMLMARRDSQHLGLWGGGDTAIRAAFSSISLPTVFQAALNRQLLAQYKMSDFKWRSFTTTSSVPDFRQTKAFRVHGTGAWEDLAPGGELKYGAIEEGASYVNQAKTKGQYLMLTREDFINDDLGALNRIAANMSFYGTLAPEIGTFKLLNSNAGSFFHANNKNLATGAGSAFGVDGLKLLWNLFRQKRDKATVKDTVKPQIDIEPRILLVPQQLELDAMLFLGQAKFEVTTTANKLTVTNNPFYQKFSLNSSVYLSDTAVDAGASSTAYYLFADPNVLPAIEVVFLNGRQRPTIESVEPDSRRLGMGFRGWLDFGVNFVDPNGAAKADGV